ncbi:MAG: VWA domain-containing protein [Acidobacteriia bacterium]|nr:VWA domain-containing protein [Terriglobia bacterium]
MQPSRRLIVPTAVLAVCGLAATLLLSVRAASQQKAPPEEPRIKVNVNLVLVDVSVTDEKDQIVENLGKDDFHVYEDRIEQPLQVFRHEDVPVTAGLLLDASGSMYMKRQKVNAAAVDFMQTSNPNDEVFLIDFADEAYLELDKDFTNDVEELKDALENVQFRSSTVLYDAIYLGLQHIKLGKYDKKVILLVTDGKDNPGPGKHYTFKQAFDFAVESGAQIYSIGLLDEPPKSRFFKHALPREAEILKELSEATGGKEYFPESLDQINGVTKEIAHDIRSQYLLGYYPTNTAHDGSWRALQVKVTPKSGPKKIFVRCKRGYYAPKA